MEIKVKKICYVGNRFGKLTVLSAVPDPDGKNRESMWRCRCDCGKEIELSSSSLRTNNTKSCGCLKIQRQKELRERLHIVDGTCIEWLCGRKKRSDNKSGCKGVFKKKNGTYEVYLGFKKKYFYLGSYADFDEAVSVRRRAEKEIHGEFLAAHEYWQARTAGDPAWGEAHPLTFEVRKVDGRLVVENTMTEYIRAKEKAPE